MKTTIPKQKIGACWQLWLEGASDLLQVWNLPPNPADKQQWDNQREAIARYTRFYGASEPEARRILTQGWPEGASLVQSLSDKISDKIGPPKSRRRVRRWGEDGDELNIDRQRLGFDNPWRSMHRKL